MLLLDDSVTSLAEASNETNLRYHCIQVIVLSEHQQRNVNVTLSASLSKPIYTISTKA